MKFNLVLTIFVVVFILGFGFSVSADSTNVLYPRSDGIDDSIEWVNTGGAPCSGANCYIEVNETSGTNCTNSDGDISYIESSTNGANQTFTLNIRNIPDKATITQIDVLVCQKRGASPPNSFQTRKCVDGSCTNSGIDINPFLAYTESYQSHTGLNILKLDSTEIEIGVSITGTKNNPVLISQVSSIIGFEKPPRPIGSSATSVHFSGQAYPSSTVEILRKSPFDGIFLNVPIETFSIDDDGNFSNTYIGLLSTNYIFSLRAYDTEGRSTGIISFNADLRTRSKLNVENIFFPPTLGFENNVVMKDDSVHIIGYAGRNNTVQLETEGEIVDETVATHAGYYEFFMNTEDTEAGLHYVRVRQIAETDDPDNSQISNFSLSRSFRISTCCIQTDFNADNKINITDLSIFLFRFGSEDETLSSTIDLNNDGKIDITDLGLFLKSITTPNLF